jgi:hypothetical protein
VDFDLALLYLHSSRAILNLLKYIFQNFYGFWPNVLLLIEFRIPK